jgi:dihydroflavonol-4-reductase
MGLGVAAMTAPVLVTGATGFVGGLVAARLLAEGRDVRALIRRPGDESRISTWGPAGQIEGAPEPVGTLSFATGDLDDPESLVRAADGCEVAYHVAGLNTMCLRDATPLYRNNVDGTANVLDAAARAGLRRVVYTSSTAVLGGPPGRPADETSGPPHFTSHYARSKYEAEQVALGFDGVEVVAVNPASVQGPGRRSGTAKLFIDFLNGKLPFDVPAEFGLCYTDDCAAGHLLAETKGAAGERYILCGATVTSAAAFDLVGKLAGIGNRPRTLPVAAAMAMAAGVEGVARVRGRKPSLCRETVRTLAHPHLYDGSRATRELGLAYTPLETALERSVRWYVDTGLVTRPLPGLA